MSDPYGHISLSPGQYAELVEKAAVHDAAQAQAEARAEQAAADGVPLEDGEDQMSAERQALMQGASRPDQAPPDPYVEAQRVFDSAMEQGAKWREGAGAMINSLVNAAHRGDRRVILDNHGYSGPDRQPNW